MQKADFLDGRYMRRKIHPREGQEQLNPNDELSVGLDIMRRREAAHLPRTELAQKIGISERTLFRWEMEGTTMKNRERAIEALAAMVYTPGGRPTALTMTRKELRRATSMDLASELQDRARIMDNYTQLVEDLKYRLRQDGLDHYIPPGL